MTVLNRLGLVAALACAVALSAAPSALADSIAYIKDGNVWLSTPDGARQHQVTTTGQYADVSQADDGTMIALTGIRLHRLDRAGKVLADFDTPVSDSRPVGSKVFHGPFDPAVSPDGTKVAYTYYYMTQSQSPTCFPPQCVVGINEGGTGYSHADRQTGWDEPGFRKHSGWRHPVWVDNATTMLSNPTHLPNRDIVIDQPNDQPVGLVDNWTSDTVDGNPHVSGGDITRDKRKMAFQTGSNDSTLTLYAVPQFPTSWRDSEPNPGSDPIVCYRYSNPDGGAFGVPTFAPDGGSVAWHEGNGIHVAQVPDFGAGCTTDGATATAPLVIPGGKEPDWGPADVPAAAPAAEQQSGPASSPRAAAPATLKLSVKRSTLKAALRNGVKVTVALPGDGVVAATAKRGRKTVAKAAARSMKAGARTVTLKFTKAGRKALRRSRSATLSIRVSYKPRSGAASTSTVSAKLGR